MDIVSSKIVIHCSRPCDLCLQFLMPMFFRYSLTDSSHLVLCYFNQFLGCIACILRQHVPSSTRKSLFVLGRLNCFHPVFNFRSYSTKHIFYGVGCQPHTQSATWRTRASLFFWAITFDLALMGDFASSYVTTSIAFRIIKDSCTLYCMC